MATQTPLIRSALFAALGVAACAAATSNPPAPHAEGLDQKTAPSAVAVVYPAPIVRLPSDRGPFFPSLARRAEDETAAAGGALLADTETCAGCHMDVAAQWRASSHAFASFNNPIYRASVEAFRNDRDRASSRFCAGCHDVALLVDGAMATSIDPSDPRAHAGVSCRTCHGITEASTDGNGSYTLRVADVPLPRVGDSDSVLRHRAAVAREPLRTANLCISCHRAFLDAGTGNTHHLVGQDDATPWQRSAYAGSHATRVDTEVTEQNCQACHMPREAAELGDASQRQGTIASHRFVGGHTWLASMQKNGEQRALVERFLKGAVTIHFGGVSLGGERYMAGDTPPLTPGRALTLDVVTRNTSVGHRFPGGVADAQDTWLEVVVSDAKGTRLFESGSAHERTGADGSAHRFAAHVADASGQAKLARETHEFRATVYNHTIAPRDAEVTGFSFVLPDAHAFPLTARVTLRHRSRTLALQEKACRAYHTREGAAFARAGLARVARSLDPCAKQPITELGTATYALELGGGSDAQTPRTPTFDQAFAYAIGLEHSVSERLDSALRVAEAAEQLATRDPERAAAKGLIADILTKQGRNAEARRVVDDARPLLPAGAPALDRIVGETWMSTWNWTEGANWLRRAAETSARDDAAWSALAIASGGAGDERAALYATSRGLVAQPRDADMLRVQSLALDALGAFPRERDAARAAFLLRRTPDDAPKIRSRCNERVPGCAEERLGVHVHALAPAR